MPGVKRSNQEKGPLPHGAVIPAKTGGAFQRRKPVIQCLLLFPDSWIRGAQSVSSSFGGRVTSLCVAKEK